MTAESTPLCVIGRYERCDERSCGCRVGLELESLFGVWLWIVQVGDVCNFSSSGVTMLSANFLQRTSPVLARFDVKASGHAPLCPNSTRVLTSERDNTWRIRHLRPYHVRGEEGSFVSPEEEVLETENQCSETTCCQ